MIIRNIILILLVSATAFSQTGKSINDHLYFDQQAPGNSPVLFAPGIVSDEYGNRDMAISPNGDELLYTIQYRGGFVFSVIMYSKKIKTLLFQKEKPRSSNILHPVRAELRSLKNYLLMQKQ